MIKIIVPPQIITRVHYYSRNLSLVPLYGAAVVVSYLRKNGINASLVDIDKEVNLFSSFFIKKTMKTPWLIKEHLQGKYFWRKIDAVAERLIKNISFDGVNLVGISIFSIRNILPAMLIAKKIKEKIGIPIVLGGSVIADYEQYGGNLLVSYPFVDYLIVGPGEVPLLSLARFFQGNGAIEKVPNLIYRIDNNILRTFNKVFDIEDMPIPDFGGLNFKRYFSKCSSGSGLILPYVIAKCCLYKCSFCRVNPMESKNQIKSLEKVVKELARMQEMYNSNHFYFCECLLNISYDYSMRFCKRLCEQKLNINWGSNMSVANLDRRLLEKIRESGCTSAIWGIETGSERMLRLMNKPFSVQQAEAVLKIAHKLGIENKINILTGFAHESDEDLEDTVNFIRKNALYISCIYVFDFQLVFGTPIFLNPRQYGIKNIFPLAAKLGPGVFGYDEIGGLQWKEKVKQKKRHYKEVKREADRLVFKRKLSNIILKK